MDELDRKLNEYYGGKVVRKELTKSIKEGANVPSLISTRQVGIRGHSCTIPLYQANP